MRVVGGNGGISKSEEGLECLNEETFVSDPLSIQNTMSEK